MRPLRLAVPLLLLPSAVGAQDLAANIDRVFARWNSKDAAGCAVAVARPGQPDILRAYGMADLEHDVPNTPQTIFEAGSVSKQFTSAAIILLSMDGKLSLDDDVRKYVPELPQYEKPVTIRHMMTHTSGLRDWGSVAGIAGWPRGRRAHTHAHVVDILSRQRALNFPPGAEYSYSNSGYNLLAVIVDRVSGMSFAEFSKKRIFEPLGMTSTQWRDDFTRVVKGRSIGYSAGRGGGAGRTGGAPDVYSTDMPFENVHGNGGLLTTVGDLLIWNENLNTGKLGGRGFIDAMHRQGVLSNGKQITYASGLMVGRYGDTPEVSHTGSTAGYRAFLARYPEKGVSSAILCNAGNANPGGLGDQIAAIVLGPPTTTTTVASTPRAITLTPAQLNARAGLYYHFRTGNLLTLTVAENSLRAGNVEFVPIANNQFQASNSNRRLEFITSTGGRRARVRDISANGDTAFYQPTAEFKPDAQTLAEFVASYHSPDLETTFRVTVENGQLTLHRRPNTRMPLTPQYTDAFDASVGLVRFHRDAAGRVTELSIGQGRVYDIRASRQAR